MHRVFLALGSNIGDRAAHLQGAVDALSAHPQVDVVGVSRVYETDPVGGPVQGDFLNAVVEIRTSLDPDGVLELAFAIERSADRVRVERWGPRTLDVDVLLYDDLARSDERLTLPHPRMFERHFVLAPLADLAPEYCGPSVGEWEGVRPVVDVVLRY
jgi:2-amino-4-hydroxy-6-hydroxymethyldihydropteridine diphosphokinase